LSVITTFYRTFMNFSRDLFSVNLIIFLTSPHCFLYLLIFFTSGFRPISPCLIYLLTISLMMFLHILLLLLLVYF
jgi:hypothetical protein